MTMNQVGEISSSQEDSLTPWQSRPRNGSKAIIEQLRAAGLVGGSKNVTIGNPGSGEEWLYLELDQDVRMGLAESAVGNIVDGASRVLVKPAVAIAHGFVGFSGLLGSVFNAAQRQSPMLVIAGVADSQAHTGETHMFADIEGAAKAARAKYVKNATDPATLLRDLRDAIIQAQTPPYGPVVFIVGTNITTAPNTERVFAPALPSSNLAPPRQDIEPLAKQLLTSSHPVIVIGDGVSRSNACEELVRVAELIAADVWASMESEVNFPRQHPLFQGNLGHMDDSRGRELLRNADFALAVGTPVYQTVYNSKLPLFQPGAAVATINSDIATTIRGHNDVAIPIQGDPKRVLAILADIIAAKRGCGHAENVAKRLESLRMGKASALAERRQRQLAEPGVTMAKFAHLLEVRMSQMENRPVIFNEALVGAMGLTDYIENVNLPGTYYDTTGGSLGEWAGAVGAAMVRGHTLAFIGDGGFNYAAQALWNAARERLPIGFIVANNASYGLLYSNLEAAMAKERVDLSTIPRPWFLELPGIDYVKIAEGYGVPGFTVRSESQMSQAIDHMFASEGPFLIELVLTDADYLLSN